MTDGELVEVVDWWQLPLDVEASSRFESKRTTIALTGSRNAELKPEEAQHIPCARVYRYFHIFADVSRHNWRAVIHLLSDRPLSSETEVVMIR